ncbi:hypothetical protein [Tropicimonas sp. IMCC6043]|uniref:hypothetical protein n=1 Tax=Tropicimonas sp. IMCC6043 TaxID=2510645 RepID=UPI00101B5F25|nr:hypothetical protein [Tropicimonas sp. IMCC6043]RYH06518.1 hypothetical protein EU800_23555 [Tropicimonas sp. IMCC6043]
MDQTSYSYAFMQFVPLLLITAVFAAIAWPMHRRKGLSVGWFLLCLIPGIWFLALLYIASRTDKDVLDRLAALESGAVR